MLKKITTLLAPAEMLSGHGHRSALLNPMPPHLGKSAGKGGRLEWSPTWIKSAMPCWRWLSVWQWKNQYPGTDTEICVCICLWTCTPALLDFIFLCSLKVNVNISVVMVSAVNQLEVFIYCCQQSIWHDLQNGFKLFQLTKDSKHQTLQQCYDIVTVVRSYSGAVWKWHQ